MAFAKKSTSKIYEIYAHTPKTTCLDIGTTGRVLVTGGQDKIIKLWALGNDDVFMSLKEHNSRIDCVKFAYNDDFVFSADENGIIKKWDLNTGEACSTLHGHMKSVRAIHFHPYGEYIISGSNDSNLRLWDVRTNICIKRYRGHISHVNSVKFSPDGTWIASAGNEGSLIIWDIRMSKAIIQFKEHSSSITCIQYHPFEFLLCAGRNDGTVDFYDLEKNKLITSTENYKPYIRKPIRCVTFSDSGECLFAGTSDNISVIGWEPDKQFDLIDGTWSNLGDMKVLNKQIYCGGFENNTASIHAISLDQVMPFYNPLNTPFSHNQGSRKSFSNRTGKLRLSIGSKLSPKEENEINFTSNDGASSPNLSIEMIDEDEPSLSLFENYPIKKSDTFDKKTRPFSEPYQIDTSYEIQQNNVNPEPFNTDKSYPMDLEYYPVRNDLIYPNKVEPEREDFPVNNAQPPDYAPKRTTMTISKTVISKQKLDLQIQKRGNPPTISVRPQSQIISKKLVSVSSQDINKIDDNSNFPSRRPISRGASPVRNNFASLNTQSKIRKSESTSQFNQNKDRENKNKNIPVQIYTKPVRSNTLVDMKGPNSPSAIQMKMPSYSLDSANEMHEIQLMTTCHESVYQALRNRHTSLQILRTMKSNDIIGVLKNVTQTNDPCVLVDILGVITENVIPLNLDVCVIVLPEIYELLKSEYKFHIMRACDILRTILTFLPTIRANIDLWCPARSLGVDITREERQNKCLICKKWLLRIRSLPENKKIGTTLTQLQNMITDL